MGLDTKNTQEKTFKTYLYYLSGVHKFMNATYPTDKELVLSILGSPKFSLLNKIPNINTAKTAKLLRNAWATEIQLELLSLLPDSYSKYSNHWTPVYTYYSIYSGIRAYLEATHRSSDGNHATILDVMGEEMKIHHELFPQPWKTMVIHDTNGKHSYINLPNNINISKISPLTRPVQQNFWDHYAMMLRTTRSRIIDKKFTDKKRNIKLSKKELSKQVKPTTLFHALYRMRTRSNYKDADATWMTILPFSEATSFNIALKEIAHNSLLIFETLVARRIGKQEFSEIASEFISFDQKDITKNLIAKRLKTINSLM